MKTCLFAACVLLSLGALRVSGAPGAVVRQQEKQFETRITVKLNYLLYLPKNYQDSQQKYPLVLFLHGAGESGTNLAKVTVHGPPKLVEAGRDFPFILVSPQSPGRGWTPDVLNALLDQLMRDYRVDPDRVYLTGLSMGGYGTWALASVSPDRFAAIVPICGGGNTADAPKLVRLPIWAFHGAKDPIVPVERSKEMVNAIKAAGGNPKLTVYPEAAHDSWTETYDNPELYTWLLGQKRKK